jgi:hypothetical protein
MSEIIQSISFQENKISWIQASIDNSKINISRVSESLLPFVINFDNIQKSSTSLQIANHINTLASSHGITMNNVRFLLSAKFMIVKKVLLDQSIPKNQVKEFIRAEYSQILTEPCDDYIIYLPQNNANTTGLNPILTIALKKDLFNFFKKIAEEANFPLSQMSVNCFAVDDFLTKLFPDQIGQRLLVNFTERGYELIISDNKQFMNFLYKPYSKSLQPIEQLDDDEVLSVFDTVLEEIQSPSILNHPLYSISRIYLYGNYFKREWLEILESQFSIPVQMLNPMDTREWRIIAEDPSFDPKKAYRFVEPFSNLF